MKSRYALLLNGSENAGLGVLQGASLKVDPINQLDGRLHHNQVSIRQFEPEFFTKVRNLDNDRERVILSFVAHALRVVRYGQKCDHELLALL